MSRPLVAISILLLFLTVPAWAERHAIEAQGCVVTGTSVDKIPHTNFGANFSGDSHWDLEFDQDSNTVPSEVAYCHDMFPVNGVPTFKAKFNLETEETTVGKQICIEVSGCAQPSSQPWYDCTANQIADATIIFTLAESGGAFARPFVTALTTQGTITKPPNTTCAPGAECADASVRYKIFQNNQITGCTNPIAAGVKWHMKWMNTYTQ